MLMKRWGICGNPHTGYPDGVYARSVGLGWLRALVLDESTWEAMCSRLPTETSVAAVITGQSLGLNNDFWSDGWRERFVARVTAFCERFHRSVRLIEWTNEWDFWDNEDRATKAAEIAMLGTQICKTYGILGVLGSVASSVWKSELRTACDVLDAAEARLGYKVVHGFAFHPYVSYVQREGSQGYIVPTDGDGASDGWERLSDKVREAINIAQRPVAITEIGIKVGDAGGLQEQSLYVHSTFQDELSRFSADDLIMATYFCWTDTNGAPDERGDAAFGLISESGALRPAYHAASYQMKECPEVDVPVARWLLGSRVAAPTVPPDGAGGGTTPSDPPPPTPQPPLQNRTLTVAQAHELRWRAIVPSAVYNDEFGFERAWRQQDNAWWGSPVTENEYTLEDGRPVRVFANAVVAYNADDTTEVL